MRFELRGVVWLLGGAIMMLGGCADRLVLYPSTVPMKVTGASQRSLPFDGGMLEVWVARSPGSQDREPEAFVLEFIGNAARAEAVAPEAARRWGGRAVEVWAVNYPGYGGSTGPARLKSIGPAALAAYDQLSRVAAGRPIYLAGTSLGTAAALHVGVCRAASGMILRNPPPLRQLILGEFGWWNLWLLAGPVAWQVPGDLDSVANARKVRIPAVFLVADRDEVVAPRYQKMVVDAYGGDKRVIHLADAGHNDAIGEAGQARIQSAMDWLWSVAASTRGGGER